MGKVYGTDGEELNAYGKARKKETTKKTKTQEDGKVLRLILER
jgi:hypothetical protein